MLIEFINSHKNWQELLSNSPYNIKIKQDGEYFLLKYDQLNSPKDDAIVKECRGSIVWFDSESNEWIYVCRPFTRFFNYGEECAAKIDWTSARVLEKIDGSLIKVWYHNGWHFSTSGTIDAEKAECGAINYRELIEKAYKAALNPWCHSFEDWLTRHCDPDITYLFELVSPLNRLVVPYSKTALYYLGEIDNETGVEDYFYRDFRDIALEPTFYSELNTLKDAAAAANKISADDGEGFVVIDRYFNRIKIKGEDYLKHFYYRNNGVITARRVIEAIKDKWVDDLWDYNKEAHDFISSIVLKIYSFCRDCTEVWNIVRYKECTQKEYAEFVRCFRNDIHSYLFYAKKTKNPLLPCQWLFDFHSVTQILHLIERD